MLPCFSSRYSGHLALLVATSLVKVANKSKQKSDHFDVISVHFCCLYICFLKTTCVPAQLVQSTLPLVALFSRLRLEPASLFTARSLAVVALWLETAAGRIAQLADTVRLTLHHAACIPAPVARTCAAVQRPNDKACAAGSRRIRYISVAKKTGISTDPDPGIGFGRLSNRKMQIVWCDEFADPRMQGGLKHHP